MENISAKNLVNKKLDSLNEIKEKIVTQNQMLLSKYA